MVSKHNDSDDAASFFNPSYLIEDIVDSAKSSARIYAVGSMERKRVLLLLDTALSTGLILLLVVVFGVTLWPTALVLVPALIVGLYVAGQYDTYLPSQLSSGIGVYSLVAMSMVAAGALLLALGAFGIDWKFLLILSLIIIAGVAAWRFLFWIWIAQSIQGELVILIGEGKAFAEGWRVIRNAPHLLIDEAVEDPNPMVWVAAVEERLRKRRMPQVSVVIAFDSPLTEAQSAVLVRLRRIGADITPVSLLVEHLEERIPITLIRGDSLEMWDKIQQAGHEVSLRVKRITDIAGALALGIILGVPAMLGAVAIKITDGGPAFFRQRRVGKDGHTFHIIKIRSMILDAERHSGAIWSTEDDPRITRIGRVLRKTRLDEVPQLWNVLRGQMSLVGPRPERPEFTDRLAEEIPLYDSRHIVNPGLTGWAQVQLPYGASVNDSLAKLEYDLYYIKHWSLWFDLRILLRTIGVVLFTRGGR